MLQTKPSTHLPLIPTGSKGLALVKSMRILPLTSMEPEFQPVLLISRRIQGEILILTIPIMKRPHISMTTLMTKTTYMCFFHVSKNGRCASDGFISKKFPS